MGNQHHRNSSEEYHASLCADAECTVKKNHVILDGSEQPFVVALLQQEN